MSRIAGIFVIIVLTAWCAAAGEGMGVTSGTMLCRAPHDFAPEDRRDTEPVPAKGRFLVATPKLRGSVFQESVIVLIDHSWRGTTGLIINKPGKPVASEAFPDIDELSDYHEHVYLGGPVELNTISLLIHSGDRVTESIELLQNLYFSMSMNTLKDVAGKRKAHSRFRMYAGYAGWSAGQLEQEILHGSWYVMKGDPDIIFSEDPSGLWQRLVRERSRLHDSVLLIN